MQEVFKKVEGFPNYSVSNMGRARYDLYDEILKGCTHVNGYHAVNLYKTPDRECPSSYKLVHRLVAIAFIDNPNNKRCVDHIDNDRKNNIVTNLRWVTNGENMMNISKPKNNTSGVKGVMYSKKDKRWIAQIKINGKSKHLGSFINKEDAIKARVIKAKELFGEYMNTCEQINLEILETKEEHYRQLDILECLEKNLNTLED